MNWLQAVFASTWYRKANSVIGGFALGLWVSANYWRQIRATLDVWGVERSTWLNLLLAIVAASGIGQSVWLSAAKQRRERQDASGREGTTT